jgi:uncharacterized membrane protein YbhN (UPF0104 family)
VNEVTIDVLQPLDEKPTRVVEATPAQRALRYVGPALALALIASACVVLWQMVTSISYADVERSILTMPTWRIVAAFVFTGIGLVALAFYDVLALKAIRTRPPVSFRRAVAGGLVANVFANALGLPLLTGGSARYRIYSMVGAGLSVVGRLTVMSWVTMWSGILLVLGLTLALEPGDQESVFGSHPVDRMVGVALILALVGFVSWSALRRRAVRLGGWTVRLPGALPVTGMILAGALDLVAAAATLYVLLPADVAPDLARYMVTYSVGLLAGMLASTPGGIGVFEAAIVTGLGIADRPDVAAALILFRLIYFVAPLSIALSILGWVEMRHRRRLRLRRTLGLDDGDAD